MFYFLFKLLIIILILKQIEFGQLLKYVVFFQYQTFFYCYFAVYESEWFYCDPFTECGYALKDDGKYNLTLEDSKQTLNFPIVKNAYFKHSTASDSIIIQAYIQEDLVVSYGAPKEIILQYDIKNDISKIDIKIIFAK